MEPCFYSIFSSIVGTQAVLNSKCLALLLESTSSGRKAEFSFWYVYFILGTWIIMVVYWLVRLDQALALFPPCFIIPVMQVFFVFFAILCGGIYFQEFVHFTPTQFAGFFCGVAMILGGVYGLAPVDMQLYVPDDPNAPKVLPGEAHKCVLSSAHNAAGKVLPDIESNNNNGGTGDEDELDKLAHSRALVKPVPEGMSIDVYNRGDSPGAGSPDGDHTGVLDAIAGDFVPGTLGPKNRKVVKRPSGEATFALPPVQASRARRISFEGLPVRRASLDALNILTGGHSAATDAAQCHMLMGGLGHEMTVTVAPSTAANTPATPAVTKTF
jgi:hypothetical protein